MLHEALCGRRGSVVAIHGKSMLRRPGKINTKALECKKILNPIVYLKVQHISTLLMLATRDEI
jgi:hypothetical protein